MIQKFLTPDLKNQASKPGRSLAHNALGREQLLVAKELKEELEQNPSPMEEVVPLPQIQIQVSPEVQKKLVEIVKEDYRTAKQYRDTREYGYTAKGENLTFEKWFKGIKDMYFGNREPKEIPWKFCSNRSLKIGASILDMLLARLLPSVVNEDLVNFRPGEITDGPKVERIQKLMHWWIFVHGRMRTFFENWVKGILGFGELLSESSWKVVITDTGKIEEKPVTDEMGMPLINPDGTPAIVQEKIFDRTESSESRIFTRDKFYLQEGSKDIETEPVVIEETIFFRDLEILEREGTLINVTTKLKDLIPVGKEELTGATPEENESIRLMKLRNKPIDILREYLNFDVDGDGFDERIRVIVSKKYDIYLGGVKLTDLAYKGKQTLDYTKFSSRIDCLEENWGEGILEKIRELSDEIDAIFNQMTDSNSLSILRPGFYDPSGDVDAPILKLAPNKMTPVSDPARNIYFPDMSIRTDQLILAIRLVLEFIERLTAASSYVLGKESEIVGGSGTATRTQAIVQSAEQRFAIPAERLREGAARIINQHLALLQRNIPPGLENRILGEDDKPIFQSNELTEEGIAGEFDCYLLPDPSMGSKETERQLASMIYSILLQNVIVGTDPVKIYKVTADLLRAYGKEPEEYLGPEPDMDMIDSPEDENTLIVQGDFSRVKAQIAENHILHIQKHTEFLESPTLAALPPHLVQQIIQFTQQHIMEHQNMMQLMMSLTSKFGGGGRGKPGEGGEDSRASNPNGESGMENTQGPLGVALDSKRKGESGFAPQ